MARVDRDAFGHGAARRCGRPRTSGVLIPCDRDFEDRAYRTKQNIDRRWTSGATDLMTCLQRNRVGAARTVATLPGVCGRVAKINPSVEASLGFVPKLQQLGVLLRWNLVEKHAARQ